MQIPAFSVQISHSRWMQGYISAVHLLLLLTVCCLPLPQALLLTAFLVAVLHWRYCQRRYLCDEHDLWVERIDYRQQRWQLSAAGQHTEVWLKQATVWRWLMVLNFYSEPEARHYPLILWPDSADWESLRRLRSCLRHMPVYGRSRPAESG
jgi:hypothetical protein